MGPAGAAPQKAKVNPMQTLISAAELRQQLAAGQRLVLLDVRWQLGDALGREKYAAGHLPGAFFVDLETDLAGHGTPQDGRHPLPSPEDFQDSARRWGIRQGDTVVAYDDSASMAAARLWWLLRHAGFADISLLDGGLAAWRDGGGEITTGEEHPPVGDVELSWGAMPVISTADAGSWPARGTLLDARARERYRGDVEPIDPKAGHIPGATSAPTAENVDAQGRFLSPHALRERFTALGVEPVATAVYCGSGVTAAHQIAALEVAGISAALYPGSFSAWSNHSELPVESGPLP